MAALFVLRDKSNEQKTKRKQFAFETPNAEFDHVMNDLKQEIYF